MCYLSQTLHGSAIYAYIDPPNHPNVGIYGLHGVFGYGIVERSGLSAFSWFHRIHHLTVLLVVRPGSTCRNDALQA